MFGKKQAVAEAEKLVPAILRPTPRLAIVKSTPLDPYEALAKELGFVPAQLLEEQLVRFLTSNSIPIFDYEEVDAYLRARARQTEQTDGNRIWIWRPLREKDKPKGWHWRGDREGDKLSRGHGSYHDEWEYRPYSKAVPIQILQHVKAIEERFRDQVLFFVSDYAVPHPDPFIMVTALDVKRIIFGVWDEPDFGI